MKDILNYEALKRKVEEAAKADGQQVAALFIEVAGTLINVLGEMGDLLMGKPTNWLPEQIQEYRFRLDKARAEAVSGKMMPLLKAALERRNAEGVPHLPVTTPISASTIADGFAVIEKENYCVTGLFMNARDYVDLRIFSRDILDIEVRATWLKRGLASRV